MQDFSDIFPGGKQNQNRGRRSSIGIGQVSAGHASSRCADCIVRWPEFCRELEFEDLSLLAAAKRTETYGKDDVICEQDGHDTAYAHVLTGVVRIVYLLADGRRQVLQFLYPGEFLGLPLRHQPSVMVEAVTPLKLCRFTTSTFEKLCDRKPQLDRILTRLARGNLARIATQAILLRQVSAQARLAGFLLDRADREGKSQRAAAVLWLPMHQGDIADYLGLTPETVCRTLRQFLLTETVRRWSFQYLEIREPGRLQKLAENG